MRRVHVQVSAIPAGVIGERGYRKTLVFNPGVEMDLSAIIGVLGWPDIGYRDKQSPATGWNRSRQIRRRGVGLADCEVTLVSAAVSAKSDWIGDTEIERGSFISARVGEIHAQPMHSGGNIERYLKIRLVLRSYYFTVEHEIGWS